MQKSDVESDIALWRSAVAGVLAKITRKDSADLPAEPERLLDSPTYEGFPIRPLYTGLDALPEPPMPGQWPFVRGADGGRDVKSGWRVAEAFPTGGSAGADGNGAVWRHDLVTGKRHELAGPSGPLTAFAVARDGA